MRPDGYCALLGSGDPSQDQALRRCAERNGLTAVALEGGTLLVGARCPILTLPDRAGVVLGTLFDRSGRLADVAPQTAANWISSRGKALIETHWGAYLAILATPTGPLLLREPSGLFPCYYQRCGDRLLVASDLAWASLAGENARRICWPEIHAQLQYFSRRTARTAIEGLHELLPGSSLRAGSGPLEPEMLWSPYALAGSWDPPMPFTEAAERLHRVASLSIGAWARL